MGGRIMLKVRLFKKEFTFRSTAEKVNDFFRNAVVPDRTALQKEAKEYEKILYERKMAANTQTRG